ncbi:vascular cell adhesion protein 1, putative [Trichonephila clavata]|uniref:Vascular cell adhesion protein 1, putative n=1 Tax=Trichonephila clavata TaxID=2740835 RepID=A0A8X6G9L6_TRICU|nr:vascular cell adhesion protein 1, putative [Trichonephila clavata]
MKKADDLLPTSAECELEIKKTPQLHLSLEKMASKNQLEEAKLTAPYRPDSSDEMVYADLYDDVKAGKVPDPRMKPPLPPKGIGKKPKEPPLPPKTKKGGFFDSLGI